MIIPRRLNKLQHESSDRYSLYRLTSWNKISTSYLYWVKNYISKAMTAMLHLSHYSNYVRPWPCYPIYLTIYLLHRHPLFTPIYLHSDLAPMWHKHIRFSQKKNCFKKWTHSFKLFVIFLWPDVTPLQNHMNQLYIMALFGKGRGMRIFIPHLSQK
jgi:hypothetical protein